MEGIVIRIDLLWKQVHWINEMVLLGDGVDLW